MPEIRYLFVRNKEEEEREKAARSLIDRWAEIGCLIDNSVTGIYKVNNTYIMKTHYSIDEF